MKAGFLQAFSKLLEIPRSTTGKYEFSDTHGILCLVILQSLCENRGTWWLKFANELKAIATSGISRWLSLLKQDTGNKFCTSETTCELDATPISNIQRCVGRWVFFDE